MYRVGAAKADITCLVKGAGMMGYGMFFNTAEGIETPLYARAIVIEDTVSNKRTCIVVAEMAFITVSIQQGVIKKLKTLSPQSGYDEHSLMLLAQHTHSGPGGYSHYHFYNISIPGFVKEVYETFVKGISSAIVEAESKLQNATISFKADSFSLDKQVAFNRSLDQYNANPEVTKKITRETANEGVNREMLLLEARDENGILITSISWFGVHTTSISNDNHKLCSDNKGYAATFLEDKLKSQNKDFVGVFAQGSCGDVTPRFKFNHSRPYQRGKWDGMYEDDFKSAAFNGQLQCDKAIEIIQEADKKAVTGEVVSKSLFVKFNDIRCDKKFTNGKENCFTSDACQGIAFFGGARVDGPGGHPIIIFVGIAVSRVLRLWDKLMANFQGEEKKNYVRRKYETQGKKDIFMQTNARKILIKRTFVPKWLSMLDPSVDLMRNFLIKEGYKEKTWTAQVLPIQIIRLGNLAICGLPFEITTIAANRLKTSLQASLKEAGVEQVILAPYANGYSGYITTNEEYQVQMYEGGHTVFGQWSLAALQTKFDELANYFKKENAQKDVKHDAALPETSVEEMMKFPFYVPKWYIKKHGLHPSGL